MNKRYVVEWKPNRYWRRSVVDHKTVGEALEHAGMIGAAQSKHRVVELKTVERVVKRVYPKHKGK